MTPGIVTQTMRGTDLVDEETGTIWDSATGFGADGELRRDPAPAVGADSVPPKTSTRSGPTGRYETSPRKYPGEPEPLLLNPVGLDLVDG